MPPHPPLGRRFRGTSGAAHLRRLSATMASKNGSNGKGSGPIRTAVVGLGRAGWGIHVKALQDRQDFKIVACVDPEAERRKEAEQVLGCRTYPDWKSFLKDPGDVELVIIA